MTGSLYTMGNNGQIDNTDYYRLPDGRQLEDFIADYDLSFAEGSALKYLWRAGRKDGEPAEKDRAKAAHYIRFIARTQGISEQGARASVEDLLDEARRGAPAPSVCRLVRG